VFGNVGVFDLGTKIFLQQVEHRRALLLYTLMPVFSRCDPPLPKSLTGNKQKNARMHHLAQMIGTDHDFSTFSLPDLSAYGVEPTSTRLGLVAARESPNAIDADQMSHEESITALCLARS